MSYLGPPFEHDIIISYSHVNNRKRLGKKTGWVDDFEEDLMNELSELVGRSDSIKIWRDKHELDSNQEIDEEIQNRIGDTALFLALTSRGYVRQDSYCRKELEWYCDRMKQDVYGRKIGTRSRIFNILLNNIKREEWPDEYCGYGLQFHDETEFGHPLNRNDLTYSQQLRKLAEEIFETFLAFSKLLLDNSAAKVLEETNAEPESPSHTYEGVTVFLASTVDDSLHYDVKQPLQNALEQKGVKVITGIPPPRSGEDHDKAIEGAISQVQLSVHLFNEYPGGTVDGQPDDFYPQRQAELVLKKDVPQFIWVPQPLKFEAIRHEKHRAFLTQLENGQRTKTSYRFVRAPAESVTRKVFTALDEILQPPISIPGSVGRAVLVDAHLKDQSYALDLSDFLVGCKVVPVILPSADDPEKNIRGFEQILRQVSLLIVVFGNVAQEWVVARIAQALKIACAAEHRTLKVCGVYLPEQDGANQERQLDLGLLPLSMPYTWFTDPQRLVPLLEKLARS